MATTNPARTGIPNRVSAFSAHKNGSTQSLSTGSFLPVSFGTERYDLRGDFASSAWTPPAGLIHMNASVSVNTQITNGIVISIFKNGVEFARGDQPVSTNATGVAAQDIASGTDVYDVRCFTGTATDINGGAALTYFQGQSL